MSREAATALAPSDCDKTLTTSRHDFQGWMRRYGIIVAWIGIIGVFSGLRPTTFATISNAQTIAGSETILLILALALIPPFAAGEFDISVAGVLSISIVLVGYLNVALRWPIGIAVLIAILAGLVVGLVNAFFIVYLGVESIVVTLGMGTLLTGAGVGIRNLTTSGIDGRLITAMRDSVFGIPLVFYYGLVLTILMWYIFAYTPLGRYVYFVGASRDVARLSGIRVDAIRTGALLTSALLSAVAGVALAGWLGASDANIAANFLLPAFAAVFLGSTAITPGRFNPWGTFIAVYFLVTGVNGLEFLGLAGWIEQVFYGASLILAVALSRVASRRQGA
jgi:ribose transport system permease protein